MPIYSVQGPDGRTYDVEGPAGADEASVINAVRQHLAPREGLVNAAIGGTKRMFSSNQTGLASLTGDPNAAASQGLDRAQTLATQYPSQVGLDRLKDKYNEGGILSAAGEVARQGAYMAAEQAPQLGSAILGARVGAMGGSLLGPAGTGIGAIVGAGLGAAIPSFTQQYGSNLERQAQAQKDQGAPVDVSRGAAAAAAVPQAALDAGSSAFLLGKTLIGAVAGPGVRQFLQKGATEASERLAKEGLLKIVAKGTLTGLAAEVPTEVTQQMLERAQAGLPLTSPDAIKEYGDTAYAVGLLGPLGAFGRFADRSQARGGSPSAEAEFRKQAGLDTAAPAPEAAPPPPVVPPDPQSVMRAEAQKAPEVPLDAPLMDPSEGPLGPDPSLVDTRPMPPAPQRSVPPPIAPFTAPPSPTEVVDGQLVPRVPDARMSQEEANTAAVRVQREQAALQASITRAGKKPPMDPQEVAALDAQAMQEQGFAPAAPEPAPLPDPSQFMQAPAAPSPIAQAAQADAERVAVAKAEADAKWAKQPIQIRLSKDPDLKRGLEQMRQDIGWLQQGGKASIHPDTWFDLPFAEAEKMREKAGTTSWIPRSDWWRERPVRIKESDSLKALDKALKGEKLKPNERKFVAWMERVYREGPDAAMRSDGVAEPVDDYTAGRLEAEGQGIDSMAEAERRLSNGERVFGFDEMDEAPFEITSVETLRKQTPDRLMSLGVAEPNADDARSFGPGRKRPRSSRGAEPDRAYRIAVQRLGRDARMDEYEAEADWIRKNGEQVPRPKATPAPAATNPSRAYEGRSITASDGQQLTFDFETRPGTTETQAARGSAFIDSLVTMRDRRRGASVLADGLTRDFVRSGTTSLIGQNVGSDHDFAVAAQVFRDPRVEHLRFHLVKDGKVIDQIYVSSRLPGAVDFAPSAAQQTLQFEMQRTGATGYYIQHNHPSGDPTPSGLGSYMNSRGRTIELDMGYTKLLADSVPGMIGHVVVDNDFYTLIKPDLTVTRHAVPESAKTYDSRINRRVPHTALGAPKTSSADGFVRIVKNEQLATRKGFVTLIATEAGGAIKAIVEYPLEMLSGADRGDMGAVARIRRLRAGAGAAQHIVAVGHYSDSISLAMLQSRGLSGLSLTVDDAGDIRGAPQLASRRDKLTNKINSSRGVKSTGTGGVFDEQAPLVQVAPEMPAGKVKVGGGEYSMLPHMRLTESQKQIMVSMMQERGEQIAVARAAPAAKQPSFEDLTALLSRKPGEGVASSDVMRRYVEMYNGMAQDVDTAARAFRFDQSNENRLKFHAAKELLGIATAPFMGYKSEAGRTLAVLSRMGDSLRASEYLMNQMAGGGDAAILDYATRIEQANGDKAKIAAITKAIYTPTWWDKFYEYWINAILSGPLTHAANIIGNGFFLTTETAAQGIAAVAGKGSMAEFQSRVGAMTHGVFTGLKNAKAAFITEEAQLDENTQFDYGRRKAIDGKLGRVIRIPGRSLMAMDEFFKSIAYHSELAGLAMREAKGDRTRFNEIMGGILGRPDLKEAAHKAAARLTFQDPLGPVMGQINAAAVKSRYAKLIIPFVRTPTNIIKRAVEYTPLGMGMAQVRAALAGGGADQSVAVARMTIGSGLMLGAISLAAQGLLTGAGPDDPGEKEEWRRLGKQPYSVKVGNQWIRYSRIEPLATWLGIAGDMYEISGSVGAAGGISEDNFGDIASLVVTSIALNLGDKTFLRGVSDFAQAYNDPKRYLTRWAQSMLLSPIPNIIAQPAREMDPYMREARNLTDQAISRIPIARETLAKRLDLAGEPVKNPGGKFVLPFQTSEERADPLASALLELGVFKRLPARKFVQSGSEYEFTDDQYERYAAFVQKARYSALSPLVNSPQFKQLKQANPIQAAAILERQWDQIGNQGKLVFLSQNPDVRQDLFSKRKLRTLDPSNYVSTP